MVGIALEHSGRAAAAPFVEAAGATFPIVVDEHGITSAHLGFKAVPNGVLVDEVGVIQWAKFGGFSIENAEDVAVVERFLAGDDPGSSPDTAQPYQLGPTERELVATKLQLGHVFAGEGRGEDAVAAWRDALRFDPENLTIRKQIWAAEHPERFHPTIDWDWQRTQLKFEREQEIAAGICGPDGCPLPWANAEGNKA